jgi:hypothetical protein
MSIFKVSIENQFKGEDKIILLTVDDEGCDILLKSIKEIIELNKNISMLLDGINYEFIIGNRDEVYIDNESIKFILSKENIIDFYEKINQLAIASHPGHQYIDLSHPVDTLMVSKNEYNV